MADDDRIEALRHDVGVLADKLATAQNRIEALETALKRIAMTPHFANRWSRDIAREALDA